MSAKVEVPPPAELQRRVAALGAFAPLRGRLPAEPPVHLVGGAVRDLLSGREPRELDLAVEGDALAVARVLGGDVRTYPRFGTATVRRGERTIDLAATRRERYASPGALPEIEPATIAEDLARRDFTVNALAVALNGERAGALRAVPDALDDLGVGRLRVLHERSFHDDPTRLIRLARYAGRLGFAVEPRTAALATAAAAAGAPATVSAERLVAELRLLAAEDDPAAAFAVLRELGIDVAIAPGFGIDDPTRLRRALTLLDGHGRPDWLVLGLAHGATLLSGSDAGRAAAVTRAADDLAPALAAAGRPSEIAAAVGEAPLEVVAAAGAGGGAPEAAAARWLGQLRHVTLQITGADLVAAGVPAGPAVGAGLRAARDGVLDGRLSGREAELAEALRAASQGG